MDLTKYGEGDYLGEGWHDVIVQSFEEKRVGQNQTPLVEFAVVSQTGQKSRATFFLTDKAMWRLAQFAAACGLDEAAMKDYEHRNLINRRVTVEVEKDDKGYHNVEGWKPCENAVAPPTPQPAPEPTQNAMPPTQESESDDDLPF